MKEIIQNADQEWEKRANAVSEEEMRWGNVGIAAEAGQVGDIEVE